MEGDGRRSVLELFEASERGDVERVRGILEQDGSLARAVAVGRNDGWTILHEAAKRGHADIVALLLRYGAEPNAREAGDNTYPLHWAAARGDIGIMRSLLDAGGDVNGFGADHAGDVIGWATLFTEPGKDVRAVAAFLVSRGARHSIFSAMAVGDANLVRAVAVEDPATLNRRLSRFEHGMTPLHFAVAGKRDDLLALLIELGADLEAEDLHGQTPLAAALATSNHAAASRLQAAGATPPRTIDPESFRTEAAKLSASVTKIIPMINVPDVAAALGWYVSVGFTEVGRVGDDEVINWGMVRYGGAEIMLNMHGTKGRQPVSLWLYTEHVDELYKLFKARQLAAAQAVASNAPYDGPAVEIIVDIYDPPYGGREFAIRDLNGYELFFRRG